MSRPAPNRRCNLPPEKAPTTPTSDAAAKNTPYPVLVRCKVRFPYTTIRPNTMFWENASTATVPARSLRERCWRNSFRPWRKSAPKPDRCRPRSTPASC